MTMGGLPEDKSAAIRFGERETADSSNLHARTSIAARREDLPTYELDGMNKNGAAVGTVDQAGEDVDGFGSMPLDQKEMHRMGKEQEMNRVFRQFSLLSFTVVLMATWEFELLANTQGLICGGRAGLFWSYIWTFCGYGFLIASLAEMASMAPTAGGQYHWVSEFAPPQYQKFLSYVTGWLAALCWQAGNASGGFLCGFLIQALIVIGNPSYTMPNWQATLLVFPVMIVCLIANIWFSNALPAMQSVLIVLHIFGFLGLVITLWVLGPRISAYDALLNFENEGGWASMGVAVMVGQISAVQALASSDAAAHMAEESKDAGATVPRAMICTYFINGSMGFIVLVTYLFAMPNVDDAVNDPTAFPMLYVFQQAMPIEGTIVFTVLVMTLLLGGNISFQASTARQTFAFARDRGFPFSSWVGKVNPKLMIPANAVIVSTTITILLSLINIGSSAAFNAIISLSIVAQMGTYLISVSCVLYRRVTAPHLLPDCRWSLGRWGVTINTIAVCYSLQVFFWSFWPNATPVTAESFNWAPVMFILTVVASLITYAIKGRKLYVGPVAYIEGRREHSQSA